MLRLMCATTVKLVQGDSIKLNVQSLDQKTCCRRFCLVWLDELEVFEMCHRWEMNGCLMECMNGASAELLVDMEMSLEFFLSSLFVWA